jgi:ketosteroid isomerase-like protein
MPAELATPLRDTGRTMSRENVERVEEIVNAFNSEDIELILSLTQPEFELDVPPELSAEPDVYRGPDGMRRYWASFKDAMDEIRIEPERLYDAGETVVIAMRVTAKGRRTAIPVEQRTAGVWTLRDGKVTHIRAYASLSEALRAQGLEE